MLCWVLSSGSSAGGRKTKPSGPSDRWCTVVYDICGNRDHHIRNKIYEEMADVYREAAIAAAAAGPPKFKKPKNGGGGGQREEAEIENRRKRMIGKWIDWCGEGEV